MNADGELPRPRRKDRSSSTRAQDLHARLGSRSSHGRALSRPPRRPKRAATSTREHGALPPPGSRPIGSNGLATRETSRDASGVDSKIVTKPTEVEARSSKTTLPIPALPRGGWHETSRRFDCDLRRFSTIGRDHPGSSSSTRRRPGQTTRRAPQIQFRDLPAALDGGGGHPSVRHWFHRNVMKAMDGSHHPALTTQKRRASCGARRSIIACRARPPIRAKLRKAISADLGPHKIDSTMAFMFDVASSSPTRWAWRPDAASQFTTRCGRFPEGEVARGSSPPRGRARRLRHARGGIRARPPRRSWRRAAAPRVCPTAATPSTSRPAAAFITVEQLALVFPEAQIVVGFDVDDTLIYSGTRVQCAPARVRPDVIRPKNLPA